MDNNQVGILLCSEKLHIKLINYDILIRLCKTLKYTKSKIDYG